MEVEKVSIHGGHSGEFCNHAENTLEDVILTYINNGFSWVGITEHIPPAEERFLYPEELEAGLTVADLNKRFRRFISVCRQLQKKYRKSITLFVGLEIEAYSGYQSHVEKLLREFSPDYMVGSVHHVDDIAIDYSVEEYHRAAEKAGGINQLYCRYFDQQYEMIEKLKPQVIGHFDLIRIFDNDYLRRLEVPEIILRIERNLDRIKRYELIMDYNLRSLLKGAKEPYISKSILTMAKEKGIAVVPGDDSHGIKDIGVNMDKAISTLLQEGFQLKWRKPVDVSV